MGCVTAKSFLATSSACRQAQVDVKYCLETAVGRFSHLERILCLLVGLAGLLSCTALGIAITELCNVASAHAPVLFVSSKHMMEKDTKHNATRWR